MGPADREHEVRGEQAGPSRRWLYRDTRRAWIAGVCAGIADYFGVSIGLVRFLTFLNALFFTMPTLFGYVIAALVLPRKPEHLYSSREEEAFWRAVRLEPSRTARDLLRKFQELERRLRAAEARVTSSEFKLRRQFKDLEG
jgi:phage shock protein C